mmetsp:Transcript_61434/g.97415  ORF Transcript_61434/g.97415 Transcript_61434/m.97415 type:complete len:228 (-) Transcript_61434:894-1577(-)
MTAAQGALRKRFPWLRRLRLALTTQQRPKGGHVELGAPGLREAAMQDLSTRQYQPEVFRWHAGGDREGQPRAIWEEESQQTWPHITGRPLSSITSATRSEDGKMHFAFTDLQVRHPGRLNAGLRGSRGSRGSGRGASERQGVVVQPLRRFIHQIQHTLWMSRHRSRARDDVAEDELGHLVATGRSQTFPEAALERRLHQQPLRRLQVLRRTSIRDVKGCFSSIWMQP